MHHHVRAQVLFADTSTHEDPDLIRHEAYLTEQNFECSSAHPCQVEHRRRVRPAVRAVKPVKLVIFILFVVRPPLQLPWPPSILSSCLDDMALYYLL